MSCQQKNAGRAIRASVMSGRLEAAKIAVQAVAATGAFRFSLSPGTNTHHKLIMMHSRVFPFVETCKT